MKWKARQTPLGPLFALLLSLMLTTSCQPLATAAPLSTLEPVRVQYTPALQKQSLERVRDCSRQDGRMGLIVEEIPANELKPEEADLSLRIGLPQVSKDFAASLGNLKIMVIVHPGLAQSRISLVDLASFYTGKVKQWPVENNAAPMPVQVWTYLPGDDLRQAFEGLVLEGQSPTKDAYQAPNPRAMLQAISETPGAIGYLPEDWLSSNVKTLQPDSPLTAPLLSLSVNEPKNAARRLLACLQK